MSDTHRIICQVIQDFDWGDYGMHAVEIGIHDDLKAQHWIPALARKIQTALED